MKPILFILFLLFTIPLMSQEKALEMSKPGSEKTRIFNENKRVKVKTLDGEKYIGRFQILDANTIEIEGNIIPLTSISNIKSRSVVAGITGTLLIIAGVATMAIGSMAMLLAVFSSQAAVAAAVFGITGLVITSSGIFFNEFARNYRHKNDWTYKIIEE